jgi:hypothetical protein
MSVDREYRIRITTAADTSGAAQTARALDQVKAGIKEGLDPAMVHYGETAKNVTEGAEKMEFSHRGLHRALGMVGPEASHVGMELLTAFSSPQMMGIMAIAEAVKLLDMGMKSLIEKDTSKIGNVSLSSGLTDMVQVANDAKVALDNFFRMLGEGASAEEELGNQIERATALAKAQEEAASGAADAEKELALAQLEKAKAEGKLTDDQYKAAKIGIEEQADLRRLEREKNQRAAAIKELGDQEKAQRKLSDEDAAKVPAARAEADRTRLAAEANARRIKNAQANEKSYAETNPEDMTYQLRESRARNLKLLETFQARQAELQTAADAAKENLAKLEGKAKESLKKADAIHAKRETAEDVNKVKTDADENNLLGRFQARRTMATARGEEERNKTPAGRLVNDVAEAETILAQGGQISAKQQTEIKTLAHLFQQAGVRQGETIIAGLSALHTTTEMHNSRIQEVVKKVLALEQQIKSQAAPNY